MRLTQEQIERYEREGYLQFECLFSPDEVELMRAEIPCVFAEDSPRRILEASGAVRTVFASHSVNEVFQCVAGLARLVEPSRQLVGSDVYIHQFKINAKAALDGDRWDWHQDFLFWHKEDGMPTPRVLTAAIFLQDVDEFNGPLLLLPGSHHETIDLEAKALQPGEESWSATLTADLKYKASKEMLAVLQRRHGIRSARGAAGSVLFFHGDVFHASSSNLSAQDRNTVFITYNSVENTLQEIEKPRPTYIASRDFTPVQLQPDSALLDNGPRWRLSNWTRPSDGYENAA